MKAIHLIALVLFITSATILTGCYTQVASNRGYYGGRVYRVPEYSDTIHPQEQAVRYDTTMHGDTMFIDEHPVASNEQPAGNSNGVSGNDGTVINNYFGPSSYWDGWAPGFSVSFGWPYYSWYSPWYPYYAGWDWGWGFYPPVYDAWWGVGYGFGYPYYAGGFYGYHHGFYNGYYGGYHGYGYHGYAYNDRGLAAGRIGGEYRYGNTQTMQPGMAATSRGNVSSVAMNRSTEVSGDRNAPVHVTAPESGVANGSIARNGAMSSPSMASSSMASSMGASHPIIVRRANGQTITSSNVAGRQMVVVRRGGTSGYSGASAGNYSGRSYSGVRSYSGARSYGSGRGYSSGRVSYGGSRGGGYSGRSSSGGGGRSSGGGGGGGSRSSGGGGGGRR